MTGRLLPVSEVAATLGCSRGHVYNLIAANALTAVNIGAGKSSKARIREDELDAFIERRTLHPERRSTS